MPAKKPDPKNEQFRIDSSNVSTQFLAEILGVTPDAITKLHSAGVIRQNGKARGKYDLFEATSAYLDYLRGSNGSDVAVRLTLARVKKLELENDKRENELIRTKDAAEVFRIATNQWRQIAKAISKRVARQIVKSDSPDDIRTILVEALDGMYYEFEKGLPFDN